MVKYGLVGAGKTLSLPLEWHTEQRKLRIGAREFVTEVLVHPSGKDGGLGPISGRSASLQLGETLMMVGPRPKEEMTLAARNTPLAVSLLMAWMESLG